MKLNKRLFGPFAVAAADLLKAGRHQRQGANSRRVKDMVSQPNKRLGQSVCVPGFEKIPCYNCRLSPTPVDPAGPDCYQSGTKPCESTQQCVAYGSVTRSQHAQGTWITSGN